ALPRLVLRDLGRQWRPRPDDTHLAPQHVDELGQLVDAELADETPDRRDAWIFLNLEYRPVLLICRQELHLELFGVGDHRAKLQHVQGTPVHADSLPLEGDRA